MNKLFQELQRRNTIKAAISYAVIGWAVLQVADILFPAFNIPDAAIKYILYALVVGFPIWIIFAYVFEWTPTGFKRTSEVDEKESVHKQTGQRLNYFIIGGLAVAVLLLISDRVFNFTGGTTTDRKDKSIAVLPFENMSREEDAYFALGVTQDILTQVGKIGDLRVLSNFTLRDYDTQGKTVEQIGEELGVGFLLTGSIRRAGEQLRITCELVQVNPEEQAWAENFDKRMEDVFAVQAQIAEEVANNLQATLSPEKKANLKRQPTENIAAYNIYLNAREEGTSFEPENMKKAIDLFKQAIAMDPSFGEAYAGLADAYAIGIGQLGFLPATYLDTAAQLAEKASLLAPKAPEPWKAWGLVLYLKGDFTGAKGNFLKALEQDPNHFSAIGNLGTIAGNEGRLDEAIEWYKRTTELNPLSFLAHLNIAQCYYSLDMPERALGALQKSLSVKPDLWYSFYIGSSLYASYGDTTKAKYYTEKLISSGEQDPWMNMWAGMSSLTYDTSQAKACVRRAVLAEGFDPVTHYMIPVALGYLLWDEGKQDSARKWLEPQRLAYENLMKNKDIDVDPDTYFLLIANLSIQGEKKQALDLLEKFQEQGDFRAPLEYSTYPMFKNLWEEPRFQAVMEEKQLNMNTMRMEVLAQEEIEESAL